MAKTLDKPSLYDLDYVAWLEEQAAHLRAGRLSALDALNVAEELEGLARSDRHDLANRLETLMLAQVAAKVYPDAVYRAIVETGLAGRRFPEVLPYSLEQLFERELPAGELSAQRSTRKKHR